MNSKNLLIIDDERRDKSSWNRYISHIERGVGTNINLEYVNPLDFLDEKDGLKLLESHLTENYLNERIDLVACDYNWGEKERRYAFLVIDHIRKYNKICNIFMYSGGLESMLQYISEDSKSGQKKILPLITKSNLSNFVSRKSDALISTSIELLNSPSLGLQIETYLLKFKDFTFGYGYELFEGKKLEEIAIEVRRQSTQGAMYTEYIIQKGLNHMIALQIP